MRFMIRCDVEGVTGVVHPAQAAPTGAEYAYGVAMLRHDVNAVVEGILSTGDHDIWIYDMHYYGRNLDVSQLDARVRVVCGKPVYRPGNVGGLTSAFDGLLMVGLHSKAGTGELLAHSYEHQIKDLLLNGVSVGEIGIEAALAGELGVPTVLVAADSAGCAEARKLLGDVPTVAVKDSIAPNAGVCYSAARTGALLREGGRSAVAAVPRVKPYRVAPPVTLVIQLEEGPFANHVRTKLADGVQTDGRVKITADSLAVAWERYLLARP
jgi:D-amino peptidase